LLSPIVLVPMLPFLLTGGSLLVVLFFIALSESAQDLERRREEWSTILRFFYYVFLGIYGLGVAFRAAASVARERQQQTLDPLLLLPIERRDILVSKWLATLLRGWPWPALMLADVVLGVWLGAYHPLTAVMLCLAPWPMVVCFTTFGLLLSVLMNTVMRAYLAMVVVLVMLAGCTLFDVPALSYLEAFVIPVLPHAGIDSVVRIVSSVAAMAIYGMLAAVCWKCAVWRFEDRQG
jgi:ABC-type transport system involved in multi-copper enzyme maturation permease subunit